MRGVEKVALALVGLAIAGGLFALGHRAPEGPSTPTSSAAPPPTRPRDTCAPSVGTRFAFRIELETDLTLSGAGLGQAKPGESTPARALHASSRARAEVLTVAGASPGESLLAMSFGHSSSTPPEPADLASVHEQLAGPFLVRLDTRCHVVDMARLPGSSAIAFQRALGLVDRIDFASDPGGVAKWTARHRDEYGIYRATYVAEPGAGRGSLERRREGYLTTGEGANELRLDYVIREGTGRVVLGTSGWFSELFERTEIEAKSGGETPLHDKSTVHWIGEEPDSRAFAGKNLAASAFVWGRPKEAELETERNELLDSPLKGASFADAWKRYRSIAADGAPGAWHRAQKELRSWIRANPEAARALVRELRKGTFTSGERADIVLALAKSGSPTAAEELRALVRDTTADGKLRVQATSALADLPAPTAEDVRALDELSSHRSGPVGADMVGSTATMALGSILEHAGGEVGTAAREALDRRLSSTDAPALTEALWAVGNSGDPYFAGAVGRAASSTDDSVRAAAARASRGMPPNVANPVLDGLIRDDRSAEVVKEATQARRQQVEKYGEPLSDAELALLQSKLPSAPVQVRWEIVRLLGEATKVQSAAKTTLAWWYPQESEPQLKVMIATYLGTQDLK